MTITLVEAVYVNVVAIAPTLASSWTASLMRCFCESRISPFKLCLRVESEGLLHGMCGSTAVVISIYIQEMQQC